MKKHLSLNNDQSGFASIIIALTMILILALLTVGFAQLARREQQNALNRQLSTQAYYAAESGVNDVSNLLQNAIKYPATANPSLGALNALTQNNKCITAAQLSLPPTSYQIGTLNNAVNITCILLDLNPPNLTFNSVQPGQSITTTPSTADASGAPNAQPSLTINWNSTKGNNNFFNGTSYNFLTSGAWTAKGAPGVLQVSITPLVTFDRTSLINNTFTVYLYPSTSISACAPPYNAGITDSCVVYNTNSNKKGQIIPGFCGKIVSNQCNATIAFPNTPPTGIVGESYLIHVLDYYDTSNIVINHAYNSNALGTTFLNGQAVIDVTGKAKDALKRLHVAVSLDGNVAGIPSFGLQSTVCKRQQTYPGAGNNTFYDPGGSVTTTATDPCFPN